MNRKLDKFKNSRLYRFLLKPPLWFCISVWMSFLIAIAACISVYFLGFGMELWALVIYIAAITLLLLSIYAVLAVIGVPERARYSKMVRRFFTDYGFRAMVYAAGSIVFNIMYVVFGVIIAVLEHSVWLGALVGYHILLAAGRGIIFVFVKGYGKENDELYRLRAYSYCGVMLIFLSLAILPVIRLVIADMNSYSYFVSVLVYVSVIAAYAFIKLAVSIHNFRKAHKTDNMSLIAVKNMSLADALITIFALQATMIKELGDASLGKTLNPITGAAVSFTIFSFGVYMFVIGILRIKRMKVDSAISDADALQSGGYVEESGEGTDDCAATADPSRAEPAADAEVSTVSEEKAGDAA